MSCAPARPEGAPAGERVPAGGTAASSLIGATIKRFALSPGEWASTAAAAAVSTGAYLGAGQPYLARGVVGDLLGFAVLAGAGATARARVKHEAAVCLGFIGLVVLADPQWPLALSRPVWWTVFAIGLASYLAIRRQLCH